MNPIQLCFLFFCILFFSNPAFAQNTYEISPLLNGIGMNAIINNSKDHKVQERVQDGDTLRGYLIKDSHFTFLGRPVTNIEVHSKNGLVILIAIPIENKTIDAPHLAYNAAEKKFPSNEVTVTDDASEVLDEFEVDDFKEASEEYDDDIAEASDESENDDMEDGTVAVIQDQSEIQVYRENAFRDLVNENITITQKVKEYLNAKYQPVSSSPRCQFDCADDWSSDYAEILIEKNNFMEDNDDGSEATVHIDQTLIIRSTLQQ